MSTVLSFPRVSIFRKLWPDVRVYRCTGCKAVAKRRYGTQPEKHPFPCGDHEHACGSWRPVPRSSVTYQKSQFSPWLF